MEFEREVITNVLDNANVALLEANRTQVAVNTLLSLSNYLGDQKVLELIGYELDVDISDVNLDTLQTSKVNLNAASEALINAPPEKLQL